MVLFGWERDKGVHTTAKSISPKLNIKHFSHNATETLALLNIE